MTRLDHCDSRRNTQQALLPPAVAWYKTMWAELKPNRSLDPNPQNRLGSASLDWQLPVWKQGCLVSSAMESDESDGWYFREKTDKRKRGKVSLGCRLQDQDVIT